MSSTYPEPDAQTYVNHNGTPPAQQQQQHMTDPELRLQENLQQLRDGGEMMQPGHPPQPQYQQLAQMPPSMSAHHQFQSPARPIHSPQQMAHAVMSLEGQHDPYDPNDPSRKRSKVSRACDECRRKKIRCDATSENGPESCSSCKRTGARCQFSRQPMKRGPSKGYIKELADRLNSLESQIQHPAASSTNFDFGGMSDPNFANTQSPPQFTRKRTHSMTDEFQDVFSRPSWTAQDRGEGYLSKEIMSSVLTHQELPLNGNRRTSFGEMIGNLVTGSNEEILKAYANVIHPTLPILPHDSSALSRLTNCPSKLREAFFLSLEASIRAIAPRALSQSELSLNQLLMQSGTAVDAAKHTLHDADSSRQFFNSLVYCQSLILLALASDRPGPAMVGSTAQLLGQLAGCVNDAGLNDSRTLNILKEQDREIYVTARQVFWTAFIMDRFHASANNKDIMLPLHSSGLLRDDFAALGGDSGYHLARAAEIVGQMAFLKRASNVPNLDPASPFAFAALTGTSPQVIFLNGQLNGFRESIDITDLVNSSPPHLAYQYLRLVAARSSILPAQSAEILSITKELLGRLTSGAITPLHHIFASLVANSLTELSDRLETQVEAHASIKDMDDALSNGHILHRSSDGFGWDDALQDLLRKKRAPSPPLNPAEQNPSMLQPNMAGLQHLAAAAVGEREGSEARPASSGGNGNSSHQSKIDHDLSAAMAAANEAAKAQATAAAAQQISVSPNGNGGNNFDSNLRILADAVSTMLVHPPHGQSPFDHGHVLDGTVGPTLRGRSRDSMLELDSDMEKQGRSFATASVGVAGRIPEHYLQMIREHLAQLDRQ